MSRRPRIAVVGSLITDLVIRAPRRPLPGETLIGYSLDVFLGGKGFNQAVAAARCGADVAMIGRVGADEFGDRFLEALAREGIRTDYVVRDPEQGTGVASPLVEDSGDNSIVQIPRANAALSPQDVEWAAPVLENCDVLLAQLEVPPAASLRAAQVARNAASAGVRFILNPAPARQDAADLIRLADILVPNEVEAMGLTGVIASGESAAPGPAEAARRLREQGAPVVVITLGARGVLLATDAGEQHFPAHPVNVVDTTAAGDAFCGALAVALAEGRELADAVAFANAAGALAVTRLGAEPSLPRREEVERLL